MEERRRFATEIAELGKIDFFLDHLARAVERGEVHHASYTALSPRYLARRAELVAVITGQNRAAAGGLNGSAPQSSPGMQPSAAPSTAASWSAAASVPPAATAATMSASAVSGSAAMPLGQSAGYTPAPRANGVPSPRPVPVREVAWTTVLLFLGAFLVIVASAIFAVAVWDLLGATGKLALLGTLTAGFYASGVWARRSLDNPAGGTTLTAVASALLLFCGWVAIDGYALEGPVPWAVLLLVCSGVYWFTEVAISGRFFGVIGAAAQLGWWWLLGEGIGLPVPVRLAGMAVVALAWQLTAEKAGESPALRSLSQVLLVAAPVTQALIAIGFTADMALVMSAGPRELVPAGLAAFAAGVTLGRSGIAGEARDWAAALLQWPLFLTAAVASSSTGDSWWIVAVLAVAAVAYGVIALTRSGAPFAIAGLLAELMLAVELCRVLGASGHVTLIVVAVLAASWSLTRRLAEHATRAGARGALGTSEVARAASVVVLAGASMLTPVVQEGLALAGFEMSSRDALLAVAVLGAWLFAAFAGRGFVAWLGSALYSLYAAASLLAWLAPDAGPSLYAFGLLGVTAAWLVASVGFDRTRDDLLGMSMRWGVRALVVAITLGALLAEQFRLFEPGIGFWLSTWGAVAMTGAAAAIYAFDALLFRSRLAAALFSAAAVSCAAIAGRAIVAPAEGLSLTAAERLAVIDALPVATVAAAGAASLVITVGSWVVSLRSRSGERGSAAVWGALAADGDHGRHVFTALAAAAACTVWVVPIAGEAGAAAIGMGVLALVWAVVTAVAGPAFALPAGLAALVALGSVLRLVDAPPWATVLSFAVAGLVLGAPSLMRSEPGSRRRALADVLAVCGVLAHVWLVSAGLLSGDSWSSGTQAWWHIGAQGLAVALLVLGTNVLVQAVPRRIEAGYYLGSFFLAAALLAQADALGIQQAEIYSTIAAVYLIAMGYLARSQHPEQPHPMVLDAAGILIGLGVPLRLSLIGYPPSDALIHALWAVGLSLVALVAGVLGKVRWYFFGGVAALAGIAFYRSFATLAEVWWLVLLVIGIGLLVIALTWERQRMVVSSTRERLRRSFEQWR